MIEPFYFCQTDFKMPNLADLGFLGPNGNPVISQPV